MELPQKYIHEIRELFGDEAETYLASFEKPHTKSLRVNTLKISPEEFQRISPFHLTPVPWCREGFYYTEEDRPSTHPFYYAGLYYLQEASAMCPASLLPVEKGDIILDACAAPGGKTTALAAKLDHTGLLVSNDISASRQNATLKNCERAGIDNIYIISSDLRDLSVKYPAYFDRILVDAPCSGEGMFRKEPSLVTSWLERDSSYYAPLQKEIVRHAWKMLKPGGMMLYSTCTFSVKENEEVITDLLHEYPDAVILPVADRYAGFAPGILPGTENCVRIYPHRVNGEGHFAALLKKEGSCSTGASVSTAGKPPAEFAEFQKYLNRPLHGTYFLQNEKLYLLPGTGFGHAGIRVIRSGLLLGTVKKGRFEPSQHLACSLKSSDFRQTVDLKPDDIRTEKFLKGETIRISEDCKGWVLICTEGFPLGFGKADKGTVKNKIEKGYRKL
ncbi:MAG: RsmB/NOP family class I SAM-dependent RNA methyltransferase [Solobacterium sp.]|nr:RsmB/NOP family class I SAM-dependent RNA methyltransferase [Solobacterium sp.]